MHTKKMKIGRKSEWFIFDRPIEEPYENWNENEKYHIERCTYEDGKIVWFGCSVNWKKEPNGKWTVLSTNEDAKPLDKYLPEIVYGEDRTYWKECEIPIYEKIYLESCQQYSLDELSQLIADFSIHQNKQGTINKGSYKQQAENYLKK